MTKKEIFLAGIHQGLLLAHGDQTQEVTEAELWEDFLNRWCEDERDQRRNEKQKKIRHGLYRVHWKSGGSSLAAVGYMYDGRPWLAPTNWVSEKTPPGTTDSWERVDWLERIA